jgi:hypothetical protein
MGIITLFYLFGYFLQFVVLVAEIAIGVFVEIEVFFCHPLRDCSSTSQTG